MVSGLDAEFVQRWHLELAAAGLVLGVVVALAMWLSRSVMPRACGDLEVWLPVLFTLTLVGLWATVPDTELAVFVAAAAVPMAVVGVLGRVAFGPGARVVALFACALVAWVGSAGYLTAWLGALCCLAVSFGCAVVPRAASVGAARIGVLFAVHLLANVLGSRVVAQRIGSDATARVWLMAAVVVAVALVVVRLLAAVQKVERKRCKRSTEKGEMVD